MTHTGISLLRCGRSLRYILIFFFTAALPFTFCAQKKFNKKQFIKDSLEIVRMRIIRPQLRLDNRIVFIKGQNLNLNGLDVGVLLKEKLRITLGYYGLNSNLSAYKTVIDGVAVQRYIRLNYGSINTEYFYLNTRFISLGMPLDFAFGATGIKYINLSTNQTFGKESGLVFFTDFGLSAIYKPTRWIGIKGIIGYRRYLLNPIKDFNFDSFFVSIGLNMDLREISKDISLYRLKKKYKRGNSLENAVDLITD